MRRMGIIYISQSLRIICWALPVRGCPARPVGKAVLLLGHQEAGATRPGAAHLNVPGSELCRAVGDADELNPILRSIKYDHVSLKTTISSCGLGTIRQAD